MKLRNFFKAVVALPLAIIAAPAKASAEKKREVTFTMTEATLSREAFEKCFAAFETQTGLKPKMVRVSDNLMRYIVSFNHFTTSEDNKANVDRWLNSIMTRCLGVSAASYEGHDQIEVIG